ncbi:Zn-dependent alcohol dehydrogenase [Bradyrhizobium sp. GM2.4]
MKYITSTTQLTEFNTGLARLAVGEDIRAVI